MGAPTGRITIQTMDDRNIRLFLISVVLFAVSCPCADSQIGDHLRDRIIDYWRSHSCESNCRNPVLEVRSDTVKVVRFDADHPREEYVGVQELRAFLQEMPLSAWPKGPRVWLRESDFDISKRGDDLGIRLFPSCGGTARNVGVCQRKEETRACPRSYSNFIAWSRQNLCVSP
jgi:hypothetical protein